MTKKSPMKEFEIDIEEIWIQTYKISAKSKSDALRRAQGPLTGLKLEPTKKQKKYCYTDMDSIDPDRDIREIK